VSRWFRAAIRLSEAAPGAVAGAAQVVHFWAISQQPAASVNSYRLEYAVAKNCISILKLLGADNKASLLF
jgi:hypothetical protein